MHLNLEQSKLISIAGQDENYNFATKELDNNDVKYNLIVEESRPTTLKQRFRCENKTLLKVSKIHKLQLQ